MPIGTSARPEYLTFPLIAKTFVPLLVSVPMDEYHSAPLFTILGILDKVSTLFIIVGLPQRPETAGKGGRGFGIPRLPSMEAISAVSSPQTNAPAPFLILISKLKSLPRIESPINPYSLHFIIAFSSLSIANGYSARQYIYP